MKTFTRPATDTRAFSFGSLLLSFAIYLIIPNISTAQLPVPLGSAINYTILSKTGITCVAPSVITGDIAVSPIASSAITGFGLSLDGSGTFATSAQIDGEVYAANYSAPTPATLTVAVGDALIAYNDAAGRAADFTGLYAGDISGQTLVPGVYKWTTGLLINSDVTLNGGVDDVWIFQVSLGITQAANTVIYLTGGAQASNVFWQAAETISIAADAHLEGIVLAGTSVTLAANATVTGILLAKTEVTLVQNVLIPPVRTLVLSGSEGWRMLSSPVQISYETMLETLWTQGIPGADVTNGDPSEYTYNGSSWVAPASMSTVNPKGKGFIAYVFEDDDFSAEGIQRGFPKSIKVSGKKNKAPISPSLNTGSGIYSLAGNPFEVAFDWDLVTKSGLSNTAYVYDPAYNALLDSDVQQNVGGAYRAWNGSVGSLSYGLIAPFQGFWVQSTGGSPLLTFENDDKVASGVFYGKVSDETQFIHVIAKHANGSNDAWIQFSTNGEVGFDAWDGWKLQPFSPRFILINSGYANGEALDINHLPVLSERIEIPFGIETTEAGAYVMSFEHSLPTGTTFDVFDSQTGNMNRVSAEKSISFTVNLASKSVANDELSLPKSMQQTSAPRFTLIVTPPSTTASEESHSIKGIVLHQNFPNPFNPSTAISFNLDATSQVKLSVFDMNGRRLAVLKNGLLPAGEHRFTWNASGFGSGLYIVQLETDRQVFTRKMTLLK